MKICRHFKNIYISFSINYLYLQFIVIDNNLLNINNIPVATFGKIFSGSQNFHRLRQCTAQTI